MFKITQAISRSARQHWKTMKYLSLGSTTHEDLRLLDDRWGNMRSEKLYWTNRNQEQYLIISTMYNQNIFVVYIQI